MRYTPPAILQADLDTALAPEIGGESKVFVSFDPVGEVLDISQPAANSGVATVNAAYSIPGTGADLALIATTAIRSTVTPVVTFNVEFVGNIVGTAVAAFPIPDRSTNQQATVPVGTAVDVIGTGGNSALQVINVIGIASVVGGNVGNQFALVVLPEDNTYSEVGDVTEKGLKLPVSGALAIPSGMNGSKYVKTARSEPGSISIKAHLVDHMDGLARINGAFVTARIDTIKDELILTQRTVCIRCRAMANPGRGDGNDVAHLDAEGFFQSFGIFTAQ